MVNKATEIEPATSSVQPAENLLHLTSYLEDCGHSEHAAVPDVEKPKKSCPAALTMWGRKIGMEAVHLVEVGCRRWNCPVCGPRRTKKLCELIGAARPTKFITLTVSSKTPLTPREVWETARRQVPEVIRRIRKSGRDVEYCRVLEEHKSGYPHFHLLARMDYLPQETLSRWWCDLTQSFVVDIRAVIPNAGVARYIAKYLAKQTTLSFTQRRVTWSKGFFPEKTDVAGALADCCDVTRYPGTVDVVAEREFAHVPWEEVNPFHYFSGGTQDDDQF